MVRMGKTVKKWRVRPKKPLFSKDNFIMNSFSSSINNDNGYNNNIPTPNSYLSAGQVSPDIISLVYAPNLLHLTTIQVEEFASALLKYEHSIEQTQYQEEGQNEINEEISPGLDQIDIGKIETIPSTSSYLFGSTATSQEFNNSVVKVASIFFFPPISDSEVPKWKVVANVAKFERQLDERYGVFRPFIQNHPEIETFVRTVQRMYVRGELTAIRRGDPPLDARAIIMVLFVMYRNGVSFEFLFFTSLFLLVGLKPWALVSIVIFGRHIFTKYKKRRVRGWLLRNFEKVKLVEPYYCISNVSKESFSQKSDEDKILYRYNLLKKKVGNSSLPVGVLNFGQDCDDTYDTIIVGSGPATLYVASLLSRTGRKVLVLSPDEDASSVKTMNNDCTTNSKYPIIDITYLSHPDFYNIPFDLGCNNIAKIKKIQRFLVPALCSKTDAQGGIRFSRIGMSADGYVSHILSIPGMGIDINKKSSMCGNNGKYIPFLLRGNGMYTIPHDAALFLSDCLPKNSCSIHTKNELCSIIRNEESYQKSLSFFKACVATNCTAKKYYLLKLLPSCISQVFNRKTLYGECCVQKLSEILDKVFHFNVHVWSLMAGIGMKDENLPPSMSSMAACTTNICDMVSTQGYAYPVGGPRALCSALATVLEQNGGRIVTGVHVNEFLFEMNSKGRNKAEIVMKNEDKGDDKMTNFKPKCVGVTLTDGRIISVGNKEDGVVVSMLGFIDTFALRLPAKIRNIYGLPDGLHAQNERRPLLYFLYGLRGSSEELDITGADWYRLPNASLVNDEICQMTRNVKVGNISNDLLSSDNVETLKLKGCDSEDEAGYSTLNSECSTYLTKRSTSGSCEFSNIDNVSIGNKKVGDSVFVVGSSWMKISFPSAKDPSWIERHRHISTCVVTVEADDNFVTLLETQPKVYRNKVFSSDECKKLRDKVGKDFLDSFPQLKGRIMSINMYGPVRMGISHTPERYGAKGIRPKTIYPGLYVGGLDLTVGDSLSASILGGWMVANSVLGYNFFDYTYLDKNITTDILKSLRFEFSSELGKDDIAVPLTNIF